ncbi:MAG: hypothetical protein HZB37_09305 [Planctomycetes bacterium]|nr:hypothetical protein [Planctomycetota bacterium]
MIDVIWFEKVFEWYWVEGLVRSANVTACRAARKRRGPLRTVCRAALCKAVPQDAIRLRFSR